MQITQKLCTQTVREHGSHCGTFKNPHRKSSWVSSVSLHLFPLLWSYFSKMNLESFVGSFYSETQFLILVWPLTLVQLSLPPMILYNWTITSTWIAPNSMTQSSDLHCNLPARYQDVPPITQSKHVQNQIHCLPLQNQFFHPTSQLPLMVPLFY